MIVKKKHQVFRPIFDDPAFYLDNPFTVFEIAPFLDETTYELVVKENKKWMILIISKGLVKRHQNFKLSKCS